MAQREKLLRRFLRKPKDFTYDELKKLLSAYGYLESQGSGSRVVFSNQRLQSSIKLHKPHPGNILKIYQLGLIKKELEAKELI